MTRVPAKYLTDALTYVDVWNDETRKWTPQSEEMNVAMLDDVKNGRGSLVWRSGYVAEFYPAKLPNCDYCDQPNDLTATPVGNLCRRCQFNMGLPQGDTVDHARIEYCQYMAEFTLVNGMWYYKAVPQIVFMPAISGHASKRDEAIVLCAASIRRQWGLVGMDWRSMRGDAERVIAALVKKTADSSG